MAELSRLQQDNQKMALELSRVEETRDRDRAQLKLLKEEKNEVELVGIELRRQNDFEKAKNNADRWQAAALEDEVVRLRAKASSNRKNTKTAELAEAKSKISELHQQLFQHESAALAMQQRCTELVTENATLRAATSAPDWSSHYGERRYEVAPQSGLEYRFSPNYEDKNQVDAGPAQGDIVISIGLQQGPQVIFAKCKTGRGFLPIFSPSGELLLRHKGKLGEPVLEHNEDGSLKNATS